MTVACVVACRARKVSRSAGESDGVAGDGLAMDFGGGRHKDGNDFRLGFRTGGKRP